MSQIFRRLSQILIFPLILSGCSTLLDLDAEVHECAVGTIDTAYGPIFLRSCDSPGEVPVGRYQRWVPRILAQYDQVLAEKTLPPVGPHAAFRALYVEQFYDGFDKAGMYDPPTGDIFLWPHNVAGHQPRDTAIYHEYWHLYEHLAMNLTWGEWADLRDDPPGRHFLMGQLARDTFAEIRERVEYTAWDCDGGYDPDIYEPPPDDYKGCDP